MATATIGCETAILPLAAAPWWRRRDAYVLAPVTIVHVLSVGPAMGVRDAPPWLPHLEELLFGLLVSQCLLLGIWAALGGLPMLVRWGLVSLVFLLGVALLAIRSRQTADYQLDILGISLMGSLLVTAFAAMLLPLRGLAGWRIDFDAGHYRHIRGRRGQVGFMHLAALSCAIAAPLAIVRLLGEFESEPTQASEMLFILVAFPTIIVASGCPIAYCLVQWRLPLALLASGGWLLGVSLVHCLLCLWFTELNFVSSHSGPMLLEDWLKIGAFHGGIAASIAATFTVLRLSGLKLIVVPLPTSAVGCAAQPTNGGVMLRKAA